MSPGRPSRTRRAGIAATAALLVAATGCVLPLGGRRSGRAFDAGGVGRIVPGTTTKAELFASFGAPMAVAGAGENVEVPAATVHHADEVGANGKWFGGGSWVQQGDAWLELFADRKALRDAHRVYYWSTTSDGGLVVIAVLVAIQRRSTSTRELWVLVDEATGIAEDVVYRER
jgi:hypothetical protein